MQLQSRTRTSNGASRALRASLQIAGLALALAVLAPQASADRRDRSGSEVVASTCAGCHATGQNGAPKIGDEKAWAPRAARGLSALTATALQGIRNMPAHGGSPGLSDIEIERAIVHMVNLSGGRWVEPLPGASPAVMRSGEQVVTMHCSKCHGDGLGGAPKVGDRVAWSPRMARGLDTLVASAVHGHGGMPPRGGVSDLSDSELRSAIVYMFSHGIETAPSTPKAVARPAKSTDPYRKSITGAEVYLGILRAAQMKGSVQRGKDDYHLNVSIFNTATGGTIDDAQVELRVEDPVSGETKTLEPIVANNRTSYGGYFRMPGSNQLYTITAMIRRPGYAGVEEAKFEFRPRY